MSEENTQNEEKIINSYELALHLIPTLEDKTGEAFAKVQDTIKKYAEEITEASEPALIPLAYTMVRKVDSKNFHYDSAAFGWVKFTAATDTMADLKEDLDLNTDILRYMILKSDADTNTPAEDVARMLIGEDEEVSEEATKETSAYDTGDTEDEDDEVVADEAAEDEIDQKVDEAIDAITSEDTEEK